VAGRRKGGHGDRVLGAGAREAELDGAAQALRDPLTGAYTRPFLLSLIALEARRCERYGGAFSILGCELAGLSQLRRSHGQGVSDRLVVYASIVLGQTVRGADVLARVDDGAFAVLLPGSAAGDVRALLSRIAARFELARLRLHSKPFAVEVALGSTSFPDRVGTARRLLSDAFAQKPRAHEIAGAPPPVGLTV